MECALQSAGERASGGRSSRRPPGRRGAAPPLPPQRVVTMGFRRQRGHLLLLMTALTLRHTSAFAPPAVTRCPRCSAAAATTILASTLPAAGDGEDQQPQAPERRYRPRGAHLKRDDSGLPVEAVYAPRVSQYLTKKRLEGASGGTKRVRAQGLEREDGLNNAQRLRVLGGTAKGRRLESPEVYLRPMMGKVKEALYNTLASIGVFDAAAGPRFLDLFAGSGSVGVEALSRGAAYATFVDLSADCCTVAERNAAACGFEGRGRAVRGDVLAVLRTPETFGLTQPYDVVTITPPYQEVVYGDLISAAAHSPLVTEDTVVVIEYPVELGCLPHVIGDGRLVGLRNRRYGRTVLGVYICRPTGRMDLADSRPEEFVSLKRR